MDITQIGTVQLWYMAAEVMCDLGLYGYFWMLMLITIGGVYYAYPKRDTTD